MEQETVFNQCTYRLSSRLLQFKDLLTNIFMNFN